MQVRAREFRVRTERGDRQPGFEEVNVRFLLVPRSAIVCLTAIDTIRDTIRDIIRDTIRDTILKTIFADYDCLGNT